MAKRGRPTKYTSEYLKILGDKLLMWMEQPQNWWLGQFAVENNLWRQQLDELSDKDIYFSCALKKAKTIQETRLVQLALARKVDTAMAIFALKNVAGWRDKHEIEGGGNTNIVINVINAKIENRVDSNGLVHGYRASLPADNQVGGEPV